MYAHWRGEQLPTVFVPINLLCLPPAYAERDGSSPTFTFDYPTARCSVSVGNSMRHGVAFGVDCALQYGEKARWLANISPSSFLGSATPADPVLPCIE